MLRIVELFMVSVYERASPFVVVGERIRIEIRHVPEHVATLIALPVITDSGEYALPVSDVVIDAKQIEVGAIVIACLAQEIVGVRDGVAGQIGLREILQQVLGDRIETRGWGSRYREMGGG